MQHLWSYNTFHFDLYYPPANPLRACSLATPLHDRKSRVWGVAWRLGLHDLHPCSHPSEGVGLQQQQHLLGYLGCLDFIEYLNK